MAIFIDTIWAIGSISVGVVLCIVAIGSKKYGYYIGTGIFIAMTTVSALLFRYLGFGIDSAYPLSSGLLPATPGIAVAALVCYLSRVGVENSILKNNQEK